eukprot:3661593-Pyramimonas_sp.AAC.2
MNILDCHPMFGCWTHTHTGDMPPQHRCMPRGQKGLRAGDKALQQGAGAGASECEGAAEAGQGVPWTSRVPGKRGMCY